MKKFFTPKSLIFTICVSLTGISANTQVNSLSENFDNVVPTGWTAVNHSTGGGLPWVQGDTRKFSSHSGADNSYAAANYLSTTGSHGHGTINNWLISPVLNLTNGSSFSFYTRTILESSFPDRLEVRLSTNGTSTNVGSGTDDAGDFSTLLLSINPTLDAGGYPDTGWTKYDVTIHVNGAGRIAFRYYVTDAGSEGTNSNYIGVDDFSYEAVLPVTLFNFKGVIQNNAAMLSWSTGSELNNKGFEVQVSHDNKNYSEIGFVAGHGTTSVINQYRFTDNEKLLSGSNYYRLKQIDNDGRSTFSPIVKLDFKKFDWTIFGNPSNNTYIQLQTDAQRKIAVQVVSLSGQVMQTITKGSIAAGTYNIPLNLAGVSRGIYIVRLLIDNNIYTKQIVR